MSVILGIVKEGMISDAAQMNFFKGFQGSWATVGTNPGACFQEVVVCAVTMDIKCSKHVSSSASQSYL